MIQVKHVSRLCLTLLRGDLNTDKLIVYHVCQCFSTCGNRKRSSRWKNWETIKTSHDETNWITNLVSSRYISNVTRILRWRENRFRLPTKWKFIWFLPLQTSFEAIFFFLYFQSFQLIWKYFIANPSPTRPTAIDYFFFTKFATERFV